MNNLKETSFSWVINSMTALAVILLVAPTLVVVVSSFTDEMTLRFPPKSYSLRWYYELWSDSPQIWRTVKESLLVAALTTLICIVCGTLASVAIARSKSKFAAVLDAFFMSPLILPTMAFGLALLLLFSAMGVSLSSWTLVIGHVIICTPLVIRMVGASLQQLNMTLLECSASLGASAPFTFFNVTLPLIKRGVIAGGLIAFLSSFDHVPVSLMLADPRSETLPIHLWTILETNLDVRVAAVCGVIVFFTLIIAVFFDRIAGAKTS